MLLSQYGVDGLVFQVLATGFKEAHLQDKLKFQVVEADKVGAKFKDAVKEKYNAKYLDDADMVIRFAVPKEQAPVENPEGGEENSEQSEEGGEKTQAPEEKSAEQPEGGEEKSAEQPEEGGVEANTEKPEEGEKKEDEKKEEVKEAETTASGTDLKKKIVDTVARCLFQEDKAKVELLDLDNVADGYDVCFIKVSLKDDKTAQGDAQPQQKEEA